jgi:CubicO group peptidase (beta-lactamase class C family)
MTTPRDAARFGLLILAGGNWNGEQIVSSSWIQRSTHATNPALNPSYGYLWWLNGGRHHYLPLNPSKKNGPIFPGCPKDVIAALGKDDQKIYVVPSLDLVVTRFGDAADSSTPAISKFDAQFLGKICGSFSQMGAAD